MNNKKKLSFYSLTFLLIGLLIIPQASQACFQMGFIASENPYDMVNNRIYCHFRDSAERDVTINDVYGIEYIDYYTEDCTIHDMSPESIQWEYSSNPRYIADFTIFWMDVGEWHDIELHMALTVDGVNTTIWFNFLFFDDYYVEPPPDDDDDDEDTDEDDDEDTDEDDDEDTDEDEAKDKDKEKKNTPRRRRRRVRRRVGWARRPI